MSVFDHPEFDAHEHIAFHHDEESGLSAIIAVHDSTLGPALGGCRMWPYGSSDEALTDVLRLSKGMTYKAAMAELALGGGKAVIIGDARAEKTTEKMAAMGRFVNALGGMYITAEDSGIAVADIETMAKETQFVAGDTARYHYAGDIPDGNPAPATSYGVFVGLQAAVKYQLGTSLKGVKVAIQGLGHVGLRLARHLHNAGAELFVTDIFPEGIDIAVKELGAIAVQPDEIYSLDVDVIAPCALGATLNNTSIESIKAKVIAGAANNQLAEEQIGTRLLEKGILYAPDYVINAGGIIDIFHQRMASSSNEALKAHLERIGDNLIEVFKRSEAEQIATNIVANTMAEERIKNNT